MSQRSQNSTRQISPNARAIPKRRYHPKKWSQRFQNRSVETEKTSYCIRCKPPRKNRGYYLQAFLVEESNSKFNPKGRTRDETIISCFLKRFNIWRSKGVKSEIRRQGAVGIWSSIQLLPFESVFWYTKSNGQCTCHYHYLQCTSKDILSLANAHRYKFQTPTYHPCWWITTKGQAFLTSNTCSLNTLKL